MCTDEKWLPVEGFEGLYEVSNFGRVKALERLVMNNGGLQRKHERILKPNTLGGHCSVVLCKDGKTYPRLVHRLVAIAFIPNPDGKPVVDHIDTDPTNNNVNNLRWATVQENCLNPITRKKASASKMGHQYWGRPLTEAEREKIRQANIGRKATEEHRKRLSEAHKNSERAKASSLANLKKAAEANIGVERSAETKAKISEKTKGRHKGMTWVVVNGKRVWIEKGE